MGTSLENKDKSDLKWTALWFQLGLHIKLVKHESTHSKTWLVCISCCLMHYCIERWQFMTALKRSFDKCQPFIEHSTEYILSYYNGMTLKNEFCKWSLMKSYWFPFSWGSIICCNMKRFNFFSKYFIPCDEHMSIHLTALPFKEEIGCCSLKQKKKKVLRYL